MAHPVYRQPFTVYRRPTLQFIADHRNLNCVSATCKMAHTESSRICLNKKDCQEGISLDYQGNFNNILDELKIDFSELKTKFTKL